MSKFTSAWVLATAEQAAVVFLTAFFGAVVLAGAGAYTLSALHAALVAAAGAVVSFLQSVLANLLTSKVHSTSLINVALEKR